MVVRPEALAVAVAPSPASSHRCRSPPLRDCEAHAGDGVTAARSLSPHPSRSPAPSFLPPLPLVLPCRWWPQTSGGSSIAAASAPRGAARVLVCCPASPLGLRHWLAVAATVQCGCRLSLSFGGSPAAPGRCSSLPLHRQWCWVASTCWGVW
ncbi:hypothetical protein BS78_07G113400 [Paspalum vaginatum]|nr:hypothetical protein BS78_07G113400 [Paspalum vaginatum]